MISLSFRKGFLVAILSLLPGVGFAQFDACLDQFPQHRIPVVSEQGRDLCFDSFAVYYSPLAKKPIYTVERLNRARLSGERPERTENFYEEARLRSVERSTLADYRGSGYDRGHNAPAADMPNDNAMAQSFSLANMMPQAPENNRGVWAKDVERATRKFAMRAQGDVYVYTGSVGNAGSIGAGHVVVPQYLYKLVYDEAGHRAWAFWVPNTNDARVDGVISYQELMRRTGYDFKLDVRN